MAAPENRDKTGKFLPGHTGNPGGRPRNLAAEIRAQTDDGREIINLMLGLMRNEAQDVRVRANAATWLCDRGWGRPPVTVVEAASDEVNQDAGEVFDALMAKLDEMAERNSHHQPSYEG